MLFFGKPTLLLSVISLASAQYGGSSAQVSSSTSSSAPAPSSTSSSSSSIQTVTVGKNGLSFSPNVIQAAPGTKVEFRFVASVTHSVAQASFDKPCEPLGNNAFFSGGITSASAQNTFTLTINDTNTLWFYCATPSHCQSGMVGVINPPANGGQTLDQFKAAAANVGTTVAPPTVQGGVLAGASASASASVSGSTGTGSAPSSTPKSGAMGLLERGNIGTMLAAVGIAGLAAVLGGLLA